MSSEMMMLSVYPTMIASYKPPRSFARRAGDALGWIVCAVMVAVLFYGLILLAGAEYAERAEPCLEYEGEGCV